MSGVVRVAGLDKLKLLFSEKVPVYVNVVFVDSSMSSEAVRIESMHEHDSWQKSSVFLSQVQMQEEVK